MNNKELAAAIIKEVGGKENILNLTHCVTRLRFTLADESKANDNNIKNLEGVLGLVKSSGQYQVVVGPIVKDVFAQASSMIGTKSEPVKTENKKLSLSGIGKNVLDTIVSCFTPAITVIAGAGMIKVLCVLLSTFGILDTASTTYSLLNTIGDGIFYFLPFIVAFNAANKMGVNPILAMTLAAIVLHPNFSALASVEGGATFLGINVQVLDYSAQAIPMILGVWLLKYVDKFASRISPKIVSVFLVSMIDLLIVAPIIILVVGPVSIWLSNMLFAACAAMMSWGWLAVGINALLFPLMVLTGTHNATIPLIIQMFAVQGFDPIFLVSGLAANIAEAGAACAVAVKAKNPKLKATGFSATLSAFLGITEPALYGVNLPNKKPFISMLIGSFVGGCFCGLLKLQAPTFVTPSIITCALFVPAGQNMLLGFLAVIVCFIATFVITYVIGFKEENK